MQQPVTAVKGIGEETAAALADIGITTVGDLLMYAPYRYDDYEQKDLAAARHEEKVTVEGKVHSAPLVTYYGKKVAPFLSPAFRPLFNHGCLLQPPVFERKTRLQ